MQNESFFGYVDFEILTNVVISSEELQRNAKPLKGGDFRRPKDGLYAAKPRKGGDFHHPKDGLYAAKREASFPTSLQFLLSASFPIDPRFFSRDCGIRMTLCDGL